MRRVRFSLISAICAVFFALSAFSQPLIPKQLAGPPAEFAAMQPAALDHSGIRSKSALIPVKFELENGNFVFQAPFSVENPETFQMLVFSATADWNIQLTAPGMKRPVPIEEIYLEARDDLYGIGENKWACKYYDFESTQTGLWSVTVEVESKGKQDLPANGFLLVSSDNPYRLFSHQTTRTQLVGHEIGFSTFAYDKRAFKAEAVPDVGTSQVVDAIMMVTSPSGLITEMKMVDQKETAKGSMWDGIFESKFIPEEMGTYQVQIMAKSVTTEGDFFTRTTEHSVPVIFPDLQLAPYTAQTIIDQNDRLEIQIPIETYAKSNAKYRVFGEVWGSTADGQDVPVAWVGGMTHVQRQSLNLGLDGRWVTMSGAQGPFQLRNLRIEDPDYFIPMVHDVDVPLEIEKLPGSAFVEAKTISNDMLVGPRPQIQASKGSGSRLLLVHGYCSGNAWGSVAGQFSQASIFQDFNQNRSHDQFAQLIANFGQTWNSFGVVAHSQGGAASLHLYTYYWSGLDNASGSRLIQSVGTPYQGTALAGNLAAIGAVFGAGCGTNNNLTYSGASSWLSGIPTQARSKVNYYTTSFKDRWWAYDYCHLATDLFLSDPDDGTTERSKGQLSGGVNRGHKTGWCHTSNMRDPAQTTDSSRNSTMNANAAR